MYLAAAVIAAWALAGAGAGLAKADVIRVYGGSAITDSHILSDVMTPGFVAQHPSDSINYIAQGTGQALASAAIPSNNADIVMANSPPLEAPWVAEGHSVETYGRPMFYDDYIILGPNDDPANVLVSGSPSNDAALAFKRIAAAGNSITFLSRNDNSASNAEEQHIWCLAGHSGGVYDAAVHTAPAPAPAGSDRCVPGSGSTSPSWYHVPATLPDGEGFNLREADSCDPHVYPHGNCYAIVDRGTYLYEQAEGHTENLQVVAELNAPASPDGAGLLTNPFHVYQVTTAPHPVAAAALMAYVTGTGFQSALLNYPGFGAVTAFPDAYPQPTELVFPSQASCVQPNSTITIGAKMVYGPPPAVPIQGMPVSLQVSPTGVSGTYVDIGSQVFSDADGRVSFTTNSGIGVRYYRLRTSDFVDSNTASLYTASVFSGLGAINHNGAVVTCSCPAPPPPPTPTGAYNRAGWIGDAVACGNTWFATPSYGASSGFQVPVAGAISSAYDLFLRTAIQSAMFSPTAGIFQAGVYTGGNFDDACAATLPGRYMKFVEWREVGGEYHCQTLGEAQPGTTCDADVAYVGAGTWSARVGCPSPQATVTKSLAWTQGYVDVGAELAAAEGSPFPNDFATQVQFNPPGHAWTIWHGIGRQAPSTPQDVICTPPSQGWTYGLPSATGSFSTTHTSNGPQVTC